MKKTIQNQIIIYEGDDGQSRIEVKFEGETVWLNKRNWLSFFNQVKLT